MMDKVTSKRKNKDVKEMLNACIARNNPVGEIRLGNVIKSSVSK